MKNILKNIIKTRKLETEWSANFIIDGIIRNNTAPVIHVYAYKEFDELKEKENKYCYYITCITSFSIMLIALLCYISLLDIDDTTFNRIIAIIITSSVIGFSYASFFFVYILINGLNDVEIKLMKKKIRHMDNKNKYFA